MKVLVIGSGLIGVTSAYYLRQRGHEVTVVDRQDSAGRETSFANGALLTPSMADPWNAPGCWQLLLKSLGRSDAALQLRLRALPSLARWGVTFMRNSSVSRFERNALSNLRLALYSLEIMRLLRTAVTLEFGHQARGSLRIFRDTESLESACAAASKSVDHGLIFARLTAQEMIRLEPALVPIAAQLAGAIHYPVDEVGDAYRFCVGLADHARQQGVDFRFNEEILSLEARSEVVTAVVSGRSRFVADWYVVAAGSYSAALLQSIGVMLPVRPVKGYSLTIGATAHSPLLSVPVVDDSLHAAIVPLEGAVRVAGTAEFAGFDRALNPDRVANLRRLLRAVLPQTPVDLNVGMPWCGLRAVSADGVPIIGATPKRNLFINTGHGHLGWTMAAGSAQLLSDLISSEVPSIDPADYSLSRFN